MLSSEKPSRKNIQLPRVELFLLLFLLVFGIPMMVLIPPGAGYDEEDHLVRVWELSNLSFIPGQLSPQELQYPIVYRDFAYRQQGSSGIIDAAFWQEYGQASFLERGYVHRKLETKSVYSPALLFPQAIAMRLGRAARVPALVAFYICRFASLLSYLILVWLALRFLPFGKWILLALALVPMALFQAATTTPDAISNGIGFLFIAGSLRIAKTEKIGWREVGSLILLIFLLFLAKLNLIPLVLFPFLLIRPSRFAQKRMYVLLVIAALLLFAAEAAGWNLVAMARSAPLLANEANPMAQLLYILRHPFAFALAITKDVMTNGWSYFQGWINGYGYYYWTPPLLVSFLSLLSLGVVIAANSTRERVDQNFRIACILVFVAGYLATIVSLYVSFTPVGADQVLGVQGRYFLPLIFLLLLLLASFIRKQTFTMPSQRWAIIFLTLALSLNVFGIALSFYVPCGSTFYQTGLCYRPLYRDLREVRPSQPVSNGITLTQEIQVKCDGLSEVRVLLTPSAASRNGITHFTLSSPSNNQTLVETSVSNAQIPTDDWYRLRFDPDWQSDGKQYVLNISSTNTSVGQGLQALYTTQSEFNLGNLYENGEPMQEDIVLQYGCAGGLRRLWLTNAP